MKKSVFLVLMIILVSGLFARLMAADYYVRTDGNDSNGGSADDAAHA